MAKFVPLPQKTYPNKIRAELDIRPDIWSIPYILPNQVPAVVLDLVMVPGTR